MSITAGDLSKLVELLKQHPEWKEQLRAVLLSEELLQLPGVVERRFAELMEAHRRHYDEFSAFRVEVDRRFEALAEAQRRAEERIGRLETAVEALAEAQRRTDAAVEALAEAHRRTDAAIEALAEAQRRTEERVDSLEVAVRELQRQVGSLANLIGVGVENDGEDSLRYSLRQKGWKLSEDPYALAVDGEVDVVAPVEDAEGRQLWALVEAKLRLRRREILEWNRRLQDAAFLERLRAEGVEGPYVAYAFGTNVYSEADAAARELGIGILDPRGERVEPKVQGQLSAS